MKGLFQFRLEMNSFNLKVFTKVLAKDSIMREIKTIPLEAKSPITLPSNKLTNQSSL